MNNYYQFPINHKYISKIILSIIIILLGYVYGTIFNLLTTPLKTFVVLIVIAVLTNPRFGFFLTAITLPFFCNQPGSQLYLSLFDLLILGTIISWLIRLLFYKETLFKKSFIDYWVLLFFITTLFSFINIIPEIKQTYQEMNSIKQFISSIFTYYAVTYCWSIKHFYDFIIAILFCYFIINYIDKKEIQDFIKLAILALLFSEIIGILEYFKIISLTFYRPENPDIIRIGFRRLMSFSGHSGWYSEYMIMLLPLLVAYLMIDNKMDKKLLSIIFFITVISLLLTYQRGGWLAFIGSFIVMLILYYLYLNKKDYLPSHFKKNLIFFIITIFVLPLIAIIAHYIFQNDKPLFMRILTTFRFTDRQSYFYSGWLLSSLNPIIGNGIGSFFSLYNINIPEFYSGVYSKDYATCHNTYFHLLTERGILGLTSFLLFTFITIKENIIFLKNKKNSRIDNIISTAAVGSLVAFLIYGFMQYLFYIRITDILFWVIIAFSAINIPLNLSPINPKIKKIKIGIIIFIIILSLYQIHKQDKELKSYKWELIDDTYWKKGQKSFEMPIYVENKRIIIPISVPHEDLSTKPVKIKVYLNNKKIKEMIFNNSEIQYLDYTFEKKYLFNSVIFKFKSDRIWIPARDSEINKEDKRKIGLSIGKPAWDWTYGNENKLLSENNVPKKDLIRNNYYDWEFSTIESKKNPKAKKIISENKIGISLNDKKNCMGNWENTKNLLEIKNGYIYSTEFELNVNTDNEKFLPQLNIGVKNGSINHSYKLTPTANIHLFPETAPKEYSFLFYPNTIPAISDKDVKKYNKNLLTSYFSALNFNTNKHDNIEVYSQNYSIRAISINNLKNGKVLLNDEFIDLQKWTITQREDKHDNILLPNYFSKNDELILNQKDNLTNYGYLERTFSFIPQENKIYKASFYIKTSIRNEVPDMIILDFGLKDDTILSEEVILKFMPPTLMMPTILPKRYDLFFTLPKSEIKSEVPLKVALGIRNYTNYSIKTGFEIILDKLIIQEYDSIE